MLLKFSLIYWALVSQSTRGKSNVVEKDSRLNAMHYSDYCQEAINCPPGSHTICLYYNEGAEYGPDCINVQNITMNQSFRDRFLNTVNKLRGDLAMGELKGLNNVFLPRAYGLFELQWDPELATIAQVLVNQCHGRQNDYCRATKNFTNPAIYVKSINFGPNWKMGKFPETYLTDKKVHYAIKFLITGGVSRLDKASVQIPPDNTAAIYLSPSTHIGCGFIVSDMMQRRERLEFGQTIITICLLSHGFKPGEPMYNTELPKLNTNNTNITPKPEPIKICPSGVAVCTEVYYDEAPPAPAPQKYSKCGCPVPETVDTDRCLCRRQTKLRSSTGNTNDEEDCETAVLLPISMDDSNKNSITRQDLTELYMPEKDNQFLDNDHDAEFGLSQNHDHVAVHKENRDMYSNEYLKRAKYPDTKKRAASKPDAPWIGKDGLYQHEHRAFLPKHKINNKNRHRGSIFAKAPKFRLPSSGKKHQSDTMSKNKNTTVNNNQSKETVDSDVEQHNNKMKQKNDKPKNKNTTVNNDQSKETVDSDVEQHNNKMKQKNDSHEINYEVTKASHEVEIKNPEEYNIPIDIFDENLHTDDENKEHETENNTHEHVNGTGSKLIKLLDQVEEEIKNTQIDSSEKAAIQAKIKKIIENVGSKPKQLTDLMSDSQENSKILPEDGKTLSPLLFNTRLSESEFEAKKSEENEEKILFPAHSHEFDEYKKLRPTYKYRDEISLANIDKFESEPYKEDKHSSFYPEDTKLLSNKFYHRDKYTNYDTETDYETDLLDEERQKLYESKLEEVKNSHLYPNNDEYQQRGEDMEHIQSDRAEPVNPRDHLQDGEERQTASRFYNYHSK